MSPKTNLMNFDSGDSTKSRKTYLPKMPQEISQNSFGDRALPTTSAGKIPNADPSFEISSS